MASPIPQTKENSFYQTDLVIFPKAVVKAFEAILVSDLGEYEQVFGCMKDPNVICGGIPATQDSFTDDMWTFMTLPDDRLDPRHYLADPSLLLVKNNGDFEANTKCINLDAPGTLGSYIYTDDIFYFGWDSFARNDHDAIGDKCRFRIFANIHCNPDDDYYKLYDGVQRRKLPFNVRLWYSSPAVVNWWKSLGGSIRSTKATR